MTAQRIVTASSIGRMGAQRLQHVPRRRCKLAIRRRTIRAREKLGIVRERTHNLQQIDHTDSYHQLQFAAHFQLDLFSCLSVFMVRLFQYRIYEARFTKYLMT